MPTDTKYWVVFDNIPGIGRVWLSTLEQDFGSLKDDWTAPLSEIRKCGLDAVAQRSITRSRDSVSPDVEVEKLQRAGVTVLTANDDTYPAHLREIYDYSPILYVKGELLPQDEFAVAVVGTRQMEIREVLPETGTESVLLRELEPEPLTIDEVCRRSGLPVSEVSGTLAMMELKGLVKQVGAMNYVLARELRQEYQVKVE